MAVRARAGEAPDRCQWPPTSGASVRASRLGRPVSRSSVSASVIARSPAFTPSQRSGSGSQRGERCPTQGSRVSSVSRRGPGRAASGRPGSSYRRRRRRSRPPRPARCPGPGRPRRTQSRGMPSAPPQAWVNRVPASGREHLHQRLRGACRRPGLVAVEAGPDPRPEVVRRAAAAEHQPAVGGALAVDDQVPVVGERLALAQPDPVPRLRPAAARSRRSASRPAPRRGRCAGERPV